MNEYEIHSAFYVCMTDYHEEQDTWPSRTPLLAHYTSLSVLEQILKNEGIWLSNPLVMNDYEEVRFGVLEGVHLAREDKHLKGALGSDERHSKFVHYIDYYLDHFDKNEALDTYVFCLSEHEPDNDDGVLSMWRGYGSDGKGAALVIDTSKITSYPESPLILRPVLYGSKKERLDHVSQFLGNCAKKVTEIDLQENQIYLLSSAIIERLKMFALFSKHEGFKEEREWRVVYLKRNDPKEKLHSSFGYHNGPNGVEPKLKLKLSGIDGVTSEDFSIENFLRKIIIGPSSSSVLSVNSIKRMVDVLGKTTIEDRIVASRVPFRPT